MFLTHSEQKEMNELYGFQGECISKYDESVFEEVSELFNALPIGHIINKRALVIHGGLFTDQHMTVLRFQSVNRFCQPPDDGPLSDALWSDPVEDLGLHESPRGMGSLFGPDITERFLRANHLELLIRSHQVQDNGYAIHHSGKCITVFSAPNYIGEMGNKGAVCKITFKVDGSIVSPLGFTVFDAEPIPPGYFPMRYASSDV
jgi:serine/threonine-protein phosphatase 5